MATIEIDRDGDRFAAVWFTINGKQVRIFDTRSELNAFALKKMGKTGCIIDSCDLNPEQRAAKDAREARARAVILFFEG
jgi:hypothetical protein